MLQKETIGIVSCHPNIFSFGKQKDQLKHMTAIVLHSISTQTDIVSPPTMPDESNVCAEIVWLEVPYCQKEDAKRNGARWSPRVGRWYAPAYTDLTNLRPWMGNKRVYLTADFEGQVFGARFDRGSSSWYILDDMDSTPFTPWLGHTP